MESYQSISIILGIVGIIVGFISMFAIASLGLWVVFVSFVGIALPLVNTKHHEKVGIIMIVLGILGNLLLIIPGIMAIRYKPEGNTQSQSNEEVQKKLDETEKRLTELERRKREGRE